MHACTHEHYRCAWHRFCVCGGHCRHVVPQADECGMPMRFGPPTCHRRFRASASRHRLHTGHCRSDGIARLRSVSLQVCGLLSPQESPAQSAHGARMQRPGKRVKARGEKVAVPGACRPTPPGLGVVFPPMDCNRMRRNGSGHDHAAGRASAAMAGRVARALVGWLLLTSAVSGCESPASRDPVLGCPESRTKLAQRLQPLMAQIPVWVRHAHMYIMPLTKSSFRC